MIRTLFIIAGAALGSIMAIIMLSSMMLIVGNLIADLLYRFADPRIRTLR